MFSFSNVLDLNEKVNDIVLMEAVIYSYMIPKILNISMLRSSAVLQQKKCIDLKQINCRGQKKSTDEGRSTAQELEEGRGSGPYLLDPFKSGLKLQIYPTQTLSPSHTGRSSKSSAVTNDSPMTPP